jgi:serine/threonine protein kinase
LSETTLSARYQIGNSIDSFAPGHYARVFESATADGEPCAFKVMRTEHLTADGQPKWEALAFVNETDLLTRMAISPAVMRLYDCGYLESGEERPNGGRIRSFGLDAEGFKRATLEYADKRWRPYLALEPLPRADNLLYLMKPNTPGMRWRLPTEEGLDLAIQFGQLLQTAHRQRIIYLDHKLEHVYWDGLQLRVIDWNSSKRIEGSDQVLASNIQTDIHNLCVGILYPIFTGLSPQKGTLVPQPASQEEAEARYKDVNHLDFGVEPTLGEGLQVLLEQGARRAIPNADAFLNGLRTVSESYGWGSAEPPLREAREHMRDGLTKLRKGQALLREAREQFREAAIMDEINEELESELRRLSAKLNDMLNGRVIP